MALTRAMLNGMGLTAEQISAIIEAHTETTDALKGQRDDYKAKAEANAGVTEELEKLKADKSNSSEWESKYKALSNEYEKYKKDTTTKAIKEAKVSAYKSLLLASGISEKRIDTILKVTDLESINLDESGKITDADALTESIKTEWSDFIVTSNIQGADTSNPPSSNPSEVDYDKMSMEEYVKARKKS